MIGLLADLFTFFQVAISLFLIFIIMLQRGKGGGLVGALGGMGGASAFGPKADVQVLKLTIGLAIAWVVLNCTGIYFNRSYALFKPAVIAADKEKKGEDKTAKGDEKADKGDTKALKGEESKESDSKAASGDDVEKPAAGKAKTDPKKKAAEDAALKKQFDEPVEEAPAKSGEAKDKATSTPAESDKPKSEKK